MNKTILGIAVSLGLLYGATANAVTPTITEVEKLVASDGAASDYLGYSVAIDGNTAVIGAYGDDDLGSESGSAYIFTRDAAGVWSLQQKLTASDGAADDRFGWVVAIDGDTAVIGKESWEFFNPPPGAAYVFTRDSAGTWSEQQKLTAYDAAEGDHFGEAVAINGSTIVIGAHGDDDAGSYSGSAYVYTSDSTGAWSLQQKLTASSGTDSGWFGRWLDIEGDTAVISAAKYLHNGTAVDTGVAYVFTRDGAGVWTEQQALPPGDPVSNTSFGSSVALSGNNIVVGAWGDDQADVNTGAAYLFSKDITGTWSQQQKLIASDASTGDYFGTSVDIDGDYVVIGAYGDDTNDTDAGSIYLFTRDASGVWNETTKLLTSDARRYDYLASATRSVGISATTVLGGARLDDTRTVDNHGSAYVFDIAP